MCDERNFVEASKEAQRVVFGACQTARKVLAYQAKLHPNTVDKHANGVSVMSIAAFRGYVEAGIDTELLSMLLPDGFQVVKVPNNVDHHDLIAAVHDYSSAKTAAHHPDSPDGVGISDCEKQLLDSKAATLKAVAS